MSSEEHSALRIGTLADHYARGQSREELLAHLRGPAFAEKVERPRRKREPDEPQLVP